MPVVLVGFVVVQFRRVSAGLTRDARMSGQARLRSATPSNRNSVAR
jgi:hypothetical protein